jgi:hypothetical protein
MISQETAAKIWYAYREIENARKLLDDMAAAANDYRHDKHSPRLRDAFGERRHLQLGIPIGDDAHRLFDVAPDLASSVIRAHIAAKQAELIEANEQARIELDSGGEA